MSVHRSDSGNCASHRSRRYEVGKPTYSAETRIKPTVSRGMTFWLFLLAFSFGFSITIAHLLGAISTWIHWSLLIPVYYFLAMCVHDAIHHAAHRTARLNNLVGWIGAAATGLTYPVIRRSHLKHHTSIGHNDDIESFIYRPQWTLAMRLLVVNWKCYSVLPSLSRRDQRRAALLVTAILGSAALWPQQVCWSWLLPMQVGVALFAFTTVYLPHGRHAEWVMKHAPAITGFHDDHHEMPQYPWYQYFSMRNGKNQPSHSKKTEPNLVECTPVCGHSYTHRSAWLRG